ncbi:MAG: RNA polymerase sigma-70 factor (ECF subfamily) [Planctomycetota bacterium]|jgi:RNA polymerase sigma-70 factor (ECF subfamily)
MNPQELLADMEWLSRLAHRIVRDPALADDAVQEAWLTAQRGLSARGLSEAPDRGLLRRTLDGVILHARRGARRRQFHEQAAARGEALPSTEELLMIGERQQLLWRHLSGLEEPYRRTLMLRFQQSLSPRELSQRLAEKEDTIRWRIRRGLELLRDSLEREDGGPGLLGLVPVALLACPPAKTAAVAAASTGTAWITGTGAVWMTHKFLLGVAGVVVAALTALWLQGPGTPAITPSDVSLHQQDGADLVEPGSTDDGSLASQDGHVAERRAATGSQGQANDPGPEAYALDAPEETLIFGRVVDPEGRPATGDEVVVNVQGDWELRTTVDASGEFRLLCQSEPSRRVDLQVVPHGHLSAIYERLGNGPGCGFPALDVPSIDLGELVLKHAGVAIGRIVDEDGDPVEGAELTATPWWPGRNQSDATGAFSLHGLHLGANYVRANAPGFAESGLAVILEQGAAVDIGPMTLTRLESIHVQGQVVDTEGQPIMGALMYTSSEAVNAANDGSFDLNFLGSGKLYLRAKAEGFRPSEAKVCFPDSTARFVLHTSGPLCQFRVVDGESGEPISGAKIVLLMNEEGRRATGASSGRRDAVTAGVSTTQSGSSGLLQGFAEAAYDYLEVSTPGYQTLTVQISAEAEEGLVQEIQLTRIPRTRISGWLPKEARPAAPATVEIQWMERLDAVEAENGSITREWVIPPPSVRTQAQLRAWLGDAPVLRMKSRHNFHADGRGRFECAQAGAGMVRALIRIDSERLAISKLLRIGTVDTVDAGELRLTRSGSIEGEVQLPHPALAIEVSLKLDGEYERPMQVDELGHFGASGIVPGRYLLIPKSLPEAAAKEQFTQTIEVRAGETTSLPIDSGIAPCGEVAVSLMVNGVAPSGGFGVTFHRGDDAYSDYFTPADPRPWRMIVPAADGYRVIVEPIDDTNVNTYFELESTVDIRIGSSRLNFEVETCSVTCAVGRKLQHHLAGNFQLLRFNGPDGRERDRIDASNHVVFDTSNADAQDYIDVVFPYVPLYAQDLRLLVEGRDDEALFEVPLSVRLRPGINIRVLVE